MKKSLVKMMVCASLAIVTGSAYAQDVSEALAVKNDVSLRSDGDYAAKANATAATIEMYTTREEDAITKDLVGLMSFQVPVKAGYAVKSATLKLITERAKGTLAIYAFGSEISDADTYSSQQDAIAAARAGEPIVTHKLNGTSNKAVTDAGASSNLEDWTNNIDLTAYVKSLADGKVNLLLVNNANSTDTSIKVYSSDATDVENTKVTPNFTFSADDLKPCLTVVYEEDKDQKADVSSPVADTWIRKGNTTKHGSDVTMELCTYNGGDDATTAKAFYGLMSFQVPADVLSEDYVLQNATLRLVSERVKGSSGVSVYAYPSFEENTTYADEESNVTAAMVDANLITKFDAKGSSNAMGTDALPDGYKTADAWTNEIDLTDYVKSLTATNFAILLAKDNHKEPIKFYTKELTDDVVNAKDNSVVFAAEDLKPQLTLTYAKKTTTLNVTSAQAATFVLPYNSNIPEGIKAYTLTYNSGDKAQATEVTGTLPANTPVLINAEEGSYQFKATGTTVAAESAKNPQSGCLVGTFEETKVPEGAYVLQNQNGNVGFYHVSASSNISIKANQAYLVLSSSEAKPASIGIDFDSTTAIQGVEEIKAEHDNAIYNLSGMRVSKENLTKGQLYITKGKTFIAR